MHFGNLREPGTYSLLMREPIFVRALAWLKAMPSEQEEGIVELAGRDMYVNVHGYATQPRDLCRFESHRRYIDLQYCIQGGELIDYCTLDRLHGSSDYDMGTDFIFHEAPKEYSTLHVGAGDFGVFYPQDAHRPKIHDSIHDVVRKLVIKIDLKLLSAP